MSLRAPTVVKGQRLTPALWNDLAGAVNVGLAAPRDQDGGITDDEVTDVVNHELARTTDTVRVENPDDSEQYVDVARITSITVRDSFTGVVSTTYYNN